MGNSTLHLKHTHNIIKILLIFAATSYYSVKYLGSFNKYFIDIICVRYDQADQIKIIRYQLRTNYCYERYGNYRFYISYFIVFYIATIYKLVKYRNWYVCC